MLNETAPSLSHAYVPDGPSDNIEEKDGTKLSYEFFTKKSSYDTFSLTNDHNRIVGCIDPRDPADVNPGDYKIVIQTAGGAAGEGLDASLYLTGARDKAFDIEAAIERDKNVRGIVVLGAHHDCKFINGMVSVLSEMHEPSDFTKESAFKWAEFFHHSEAYYKTINKVMEAAGIQLDFLSKKDNLNHLVEHIDALRPEHSNVKRLEGENKSRVYVTNLHPYVGYNRNAKFEEPSNAPLIQGYHDSLAASIGDISKSHFIINEERQSRISSMILRSAATRTVLTRDHPDTRFLEVAPSTKGLEFNEVK